MSAITPQFLSVALPEFAGSVKLHIQMAFVIGLMIYINRKRNYIAELPPDSPKPFTPDNFNVYFPVNSIALASGIAKGNTLAENMRREKFDADTAPWAVELLGMPPEYGSLFLAGLGLATLVASLFIGLRLTDGAALHPLRMLWSKTSRTVHYVTLDGTVHKRYPPRNTRYIVIFLILTAFSYLVAWGVSHL